MKRFFILASAAIVALASCAKTEVVYKDAPQEIVLKTVNMPMTKALAYTGDLGVSAYEVANSNDMYFDNLQFTGDGGSWTGGQYWPLDTKLGFVAYGPFTGGATSVSVSPTGITANGVTSDVDFVYSGYVNNEGNGFGKGAAVPMTLYHTKAKVVVNVTTSGSNEVVTGVEILNTNDGGNCTITFPSTVAWSDYTSTKTVDFTTNTTHYVVPGTPTTLKITYNSNVPAKTGLTATVNLAAEQMYDSEGNEVSGAAAWKEGYSYTYDVAIESQLITINATAATWTEESNTIPQP